MGNEQSSPSHSNGPGRPQSLAECTDHNTGRVDSARYALYLRERNAEEDAQFESEIAGCAKRCRQTAQDLEDEAGAEPKKRTRSGRCGEYGQKEWRDEAVGIILGATVLLGDDPWLLGSGEGPMAARSALSTTLAPLYSSYVTARVQMAKMEEHYITLHQADLDEVREEISATDLEEEMSSASSLGRVNVYSALVCLGGLLQQCLSSLKLVFESVGTNGTTQEVTPDVAALLEEARLLLLCVCHLLTDDNAGETPMIPEAIVRASSVSESPSTYETCHAITSLVSSLMSLAEFRRRPK